MAIRKPDYDANLAAKMLSSAYTIGYVHQTDGAKRSIRRKELHRKLAREFGTYECCEGLTRGFVHAANVGFWMAQFKGGEARQVHAKD